GRFRTDGSGGPDPDTAGTGRSLSWLPGAAREVRANNHFGLVWRTAVRPQCRGSWPAAPKRITSWRCSPRQVATALSLKPKTGSAVSLAGPLAGQDVQVEEAPRPPRCPALDRRASVLGFCVTTVAAKGPLLR